MWTTTLRTATLGAAAGLLTAVAVPFGTAAASAAPAGAAAASAAVPAAAPAGQLVPGEVESAAIGGPIDYTVYLPPGYDGSGQTRYPSAYLLHGRGDTQAAWQQMAPVLDQMIADGTVPPMIVVMPDAPWSNRGGYYVDSQYTGSDPSTTPGAAVETAFTTDLVQHVDATLPTIDDRAARVVGGYSMGGAGALRYALVHQDLFGQALVLSPAVYVPSTPVDSSTREFGAYGVGDELYDEARYQELNYPAALAAFDPALPVHLFIAVGDDEYVNPDPADAIHDLDYEAATLYNRAKRVPGITAEMRTYDGGHDWGVWERGFREGMTDIAAHLATEPPAPFEGIQVGSARDDFAGGVLGHPDGSVVQAVAAGGDALGATSAGGTDILVQRLDADGQAQWTTPIASPLNERSYGVVDGGDGSVIVGGYQRIDHAGAQNDDMLAVKVSADGEVLWTATLGDPGAADRAYGVASDGRGGAYLAGYTSGSVGGATSAGDKDALVAHVDASGAVTWTTQVGSSGEDKAFGIAVLASGDVAVGGTAGGTMPGAASSAGGYDGWVAVLTPDGAVSTLTQLGSTSTDQVSALGALPDGGFVAAGWAGGDVAGSTAPSAGGVDVMLAAFDASGTERWRTLWGSAGDDRASAVVVGSGSVLVAGATSGALGAPAGGMDAFAVPVDPAGTIGTAVQLGSPQRDAADEYDETNLFAAAGPSGRAWLQGVTYGAVDGAASAGGADVFLTTVPFADAAAPGEGGGGDPGAGAGGAPGDPGAASPGGAGGGPLGAGAGILGATGSDAARIAALAALALLAGTGAVLLRLRRASRGRLE
ncbi:hypothetical protein GCM10010988_16770 [Cnuibacter physcomitrellae]|uniref:Uncharacterized protein n=1 Tax=Cnuibacter physcomitrellae TaxID=1619308 RepID=A0A1X9LR76_9MICO|nr:alpha/beta hydrolase-fold protein [Cnuibacter physcomitrellae]ARJ06431.1 hypothetical protein B5808_15320 [Cnuibacter physcomitrellae]GGI37996.1 hypothetical protein GCM10010988_16770 [Cnuibacter physcomitrellae]